MIGTFIADDGLTPGSTAIMDLTIYPGFYDTNYYSECHLIGPQLSMFSS